MCKWVKILYGDIIECPFTNMDKPKKEYCHYCGIPEKYEETKKTNSGNN